ncbi:hypothetical protein ACFSDA_14220 [Brachybacterium rhamnosum]|uniref:Terminase n=1 Tax=Brachybacterium rhamnosum TaxID=173361 RepID=A0ABW4Q176_9MICO
MASSPSSVSRPAVPAPDRLYGHEVPRVFTPPLRELTRETSLGFAVIDFARDLLGVTLRPWQAWFLVHALELLEDGRLRFRTVVLSVARQNGKSTLSQVLALWAMYVRGSGLVIGTAQNLDISEEVWDGAVDLAEGVDELADLIGAVHRSNGKKALVLESGERYRVQPATRRGGRGLSGDLIMLDELREHSTWDAWSAVTKTTMARPDALILGMSNAGDAASIVLRHLRLMAHRELGDPDGIVRSAEGVADILAAPVEDDGAPDDAITNGDAALGWFEWSAPPGVDVHDVDGWLAANPSYGHVEMHRALASAATTDPEWVFRTECLCQWNDGATESVFPSGSWLLGQDRESVIADGEPVTFCVEVEPDRANAYIVAAGRRPDGDVHVEPIAARPGTSWVTGWFKERTRPGQDLRVVARRRGAAVVSIADDLEAMDGVEVVNWGGADLGAACGRLFDAVVAHVWEPDADEGETAGDQPERLWHRPSPVLDLVAGTVVTRPMAGGDSWMWSAKGSPYGCAVLMAASGAVWDVLRPQEDNSSAYEEYDVAVV